MLTPKMRRCRPTTSPILSSRPASSTNPIPSPPGLRSRRTSSLDRLVSRQGRNPRCWPGHRSSRSRSKDEPGSTPMVTATSLRARFLPGRSKRRLMARLRCSYPVVTAGREIVDIRLRFEDGKVVEASAAKNEDYLLQTLDTDDRRALPWRVCVWHEHGHHPLHPQYPARRKDRRHGSYGGRLRLSRQRQHEPLGNPLGLDLRYSPRRVVTADGQVFLRDGQFLQCRPPRLSTFGSDAR